MTEPDLAALLDAEAAQLENPQSYGCTVCAFIGAQPEPEAWDALMSGPRRSAAIFRTLRNHGYANKTQGPVDNHRNGGHRR